ncbi:toprim domain-containing protein, partial [Xylella fastidiosa subsp. multiplex]
PNGNNAVDWDNAAKCWYANPGADLDKLKPWIATEIMSRQVPALSPEKEFAETLRSLGCLVSGEHPIMDAKKHRIEVEGDKKGEKAGFYVAYLDGHPSGYIKNNRTGIELKWKSKGYLLDAEQKAAMQAEAAAKLAARAEQQQQEQEAVTQRVVKQMDDLVTVIEPTPYLKAKGITPQAGIYTDSDGQKTYIPAIDSDGKQWTMQYIQEDGTKRFAKGGRKEGCFHPIGGLAAIAAAPVIVIGEGYATVAQVSQALGYGTVVAFDAGNLEGVAKALHKSFPDKPILIAGDDDQSLPNNPGKTKAQEAARAVDGTAFFPIFAPGEQADDPKGFTDFNDLATKSALGIEAVERQVHAAVSKAIDNHQKRVQQQTQQQGQHEQKQERRRLRVR